jgi:hypothetical protein
MMIPRNDQGVFSGTWEMKRPKTQGSSPLVWQHLATRIDFPYAYDTPPKVVALLSDFNSQNSGPAVIHVWIDDITTTCLSILASGWDGLRSISAAWFACFQELKGISCGMTDVSWSHWNPTGPTWDVTQQAFTDCVNFARGDFAKPPVVLQGIRGFTVAKLGAVRLTSSLNTVTRQGCNWKAYTFDTLH